MRLLAVDRHGVVLAIASLWPTMRRLSDKSHPRLRLGVHHGSSWQDQRARLRKEPVYPQSFTPCRKLPAEVHRISPSPARLRPTLPAARPFATRSSTSSSTFSQN